LLSFVAWLCPSFGVLSKGFGDPERLNLTSAAILGSWYLLIFVSFTIGQKLGSFSQALRIAPRSKLLSLEANSIYVGFTVLSAVGLAASFASIFSNLSIQEAIFRITLGQANVLNDTLHEDYSIGLVSLRYVVLYPGSLALYRMIRFKSYSMLNIFSLFLLALGVFLSSRLTLIATMLTVTLLLSFGQTSIRLRFSRIALWVGFLFLVLSVLNASRNASYYAEENENFATASISEIISYLGAPFQAEIASAKVLDQLTVGGAEGYRNYTDVVEQLNANSAFVHLHEQMGYICWLYIAALCVFMGLVFEVFLSMGRTVFLLPAGAILYGSAELWRLDLFQRGTFVTWFVVGIALPLGAVSCRAFLDLVNRLPPDRLSNDKAILWPIRTPSGRRRLDRLVAAGRVRRRASAVFASGNCRGVRLPRGHASAEDR
jgi:hypothetical protein